MHFTDFGLPDGAQPRPAPRTSDGRESMHVLSKISATERRGVVVVLTALLLVALLGFVALAIDLGFIRVVETQLQNSADAAALAAAAELLHPDRLKPNPSADAGIKNARAAAVQYAALNEVINAPPSVDPNTDVAIGYLAEPDELDDEMDFEDPNKFNSVAVRVARNSSQNGEVPLFFGRLLGLDSVPRDATATASFQLRVVGYRVTAKTGNAKLLPFALDRPTWDAMLEGEGEDDWSWNEETQTLNPGSDGILEVNLYPSGSDSMPPGNRGTVDIGGSNNSTADIARQILHGVSQEDLAHHGGELELDENGILMLNGDTGISAGVKDELAFIKGQPRAIPLFETVAGPGNNAMYTIIGFVGIRIVDVKLTGKQNQKHLTIQPAYVIDDAGIYDSGPQYSFFIYSPVHMCR